MHDLILGTDSKIGSKLRNRLYSLGIKTIGTSRRLKTFNDTTVYFDFNSSSQLTVGDTANVIYICTGVTSMQLCELHEAETHLVNVAGIINLLKSFPSKPFVIYLSTNHVFDGKMAKVEAYAKPNPVNQYGKQKKVVEDWLQAEYKNASIIRLTKVIDPNLDLLQHWISRLTQNLTIEAFTDMTLSPIYIDEVINVLIQIAQLRRPGIYQLSGSEDISYYQFAELITRSLNLPIKLINPITTLQKKH